MGIVKKGNAKARQIHHVYEYLDFRVFDRLNWDTFSLPDFMICSGEMSVWNRGFPIPPDSMSYKVEKVVSALSEPNDNDARVDLSTVYYDAGRRLVRVDKEAFTTITDFSTGLESKENSFDISKCVKSDYTNNKIITWIPQRLFYNSIESLDIEDLRLKVAEFVGISSLQIVTEDYAFDTVEGTLHWFVSFLSFDSQ
ncbi:hypothetical protein PoB_003469300 [Plakobranchus ocellatus]|uniref:Uncharacterized protein n=1 Tax=Plakobranchus ocellatus TaxID=259542 RepID=A0AAV4ANQ4_9GAST|nr:hypothetical protein PoB_003469300 [Plakobranchus ocellatus]